MVGPEGDLFDLGALRQVLTQAPLCRQVMLVGESSSHPALASILRTIRDHGVVPTLVANQPLRSDVIDSLARFAGHVAIDCGLNRTQMGLAKTLRDSGLQVRLHQPLADATVDWLATSLERGTFEHMIRASVLTGRTASGPGGKVTGINPGPGLERLVEVISRPHPFRLAADGRVAPLLAHGDIGHGVTIPRCEAGRTGMFLDHDLRVTPCSLLPDRVVGSLEESSIEQIWTGRTMAQTREELSGPHPPCAGTSRATEPPRRTDGLDLELRFGFASSSLCDRSVLPLGQKQLLQIITAVQDWRALRFFAGPHEDEPTQVAASWSSLEYFLSLPPLWGQDLARLHEQLVAGTFEGQEASVGQMR